MSFIPPYTAARADPPTPRSAKPRRVARLSPVLIFLAFSILLIPVEASLFVGTLRLPVARLILLAATPIAAARYCSSIWLPSYRFIWSDLFVPVTGAWMIVSVCLTEGPERGFVGAGVIALELVGTYFLCRTQLKQPGEALILGRLVAVLIAVNAVVAIPDTFQKTYVIHTAVSALTGYPIGNIQEIRNGFFRAAGVMEHPILLGTACSFGVLLSLQLHRGVCRVLLITLQTIGLILTVSSAPLLGLAIGLGCILYQRITPSDVSRWRWLFAGGLLGIGLMFLVLPDPLSFVLSHLTLDPQSGYYRILEWTYAGQDLLLSPWVGIGLSDAWTRPDWMPSTVDSVWLRSAMSFGIPGSLLIACSVLTACSGRMDLPRGALSVDDKRLGTTLSIILGLYVFQGFTVHFWGATWLLLGLFMGMRAHLGALADQRAHYRRVARPRIRQEPAGHLTV